MLLVANCRENPSIGHRDASDSAQPKRMQISLFIPCFVDSFYPRVGISIVEILERLGHSVDYPQGATCCGQPAFNCGYWPESREVAKHILKLYRDSEVVVVASGSCCAMIKVFYPEIFKGTQHQGAAAALSSKTWEFSDFLVNVLGVTDVGARFEAKVTFHDGCHGLREIGVESEPRTLLQNVRGLELIEMSEAKTCCGFGGAFSVKHASISTAMGEVKCKSALSTGAEYIVSNDSSCLMHVQGLLDRNGATLKSIHLAEVLAKTQ
jgi:L-lactate dehydrogenase complex protein LldE